MDAKGIIGTVGSLPVKGAMINLNNADVEAIVGGTSAILKTVAMGGGVMLAAGILAALIENARLREKSRISIGALAEIKTEKKDFFGLCLDPYITFQCEGQEHKVELDLVSKIEMKDHDLPAFNFFARRKGHVSAYEIKMVDGSIYKEAILNTAHLNFLSVAGRQKIAMPSRVVRYEERLRGLLRDKRIVLVDTLPGEKIYEYTSMKGVVWEDVDSLRERLKFTMERDRQAVIKTVGEDLINRYFYWQ